MGPRSISYFPLSLSFSSLPLPPLPLHTSLPTDCVPPSLFQKLEELGVTPTNIQATQLKLALKRQVLEMARQWPTYFCMLFPVSVSWGVELG